FLFLLFPPPYYSTGDCPPLRSGFRHVRRYAAFQPPYCLWSNHSGSLALSGSTLPSLGHRRASGCHKPLAIKGFARKLPHP
ncbi:MAG: hypothetical protein JW750_08285, partial [Anaerolineaceae bacterium]|nr:hypothetical protein [Anaerolineaceae bacterium]